MSGIVRTMSEKTVVARLRDWCDGAMKKNTVMVYGAYGHTGRFVIAQLLRQGLTPVAAGRSRDRLEVRVAELHDPIALTEAMHGIGAVINTAGPFLDTARPLAEAAVRAEAHYVDVTAEQGAAADLYEFYRGVDDQLTTAVIPAMSFFGGLADLLVTAAADGWDVIDHVEVGIGLDKWWPTAGTRLTGERNTAARRIIDDFRLVTVGDEPFSRDWAFPHPIGDQRVLGMPFSEMTAMAKHLAVRKAESYLSAAALDDISETSTPEPQAIDEFGRSAQRFVVAVRIESRGEVREISAAGQDIYQVTAPLAVEAVARLLDGRSEGVGALASGEAFDAADFLAVLGRSWLSLGSSQSPSLRRTISAIQLGAKGEVQPGGVG